MGDIFISYSRKNSEFVGRLVQELQQRGLNIWMDREDIRGGSAWRAAISSGIRECDAFIVVLSQQSTMSENVTKELALADKHDKPIIPICYQTCEIPSEMEYQLAGLQIIDFAEQPFISGIKQLLNALPQSSETIIEKQELQLAKVGMSAPFFTSEKKKLLTIVGIVGLVLLGIILLVKFSPVIFKSERDISGLYYIEGIDFDCLEYGGEATITKSGNSYDVEGRTRWSDAVFRSEGRGVGKLNGNVFTITWDMNAGETIFSLKLDGSLVVKWVHGATSCEPGEIWMPQ